MCGCNERFPTTVESKQSKMAGCRGFGNREYYWGELAGNRSKKSHCSRPVRVPQGKDKSLRWENYRAR